MEIDTLWSGKTHRSFTSVTRLLHSDGNCIDDEYSTDYHVLILIMENDTLWSGKKILRHKCREITSFWLPGHVALWKEIFRLDQTDGDWSILSFLVSQFRFGHCDYFIVRYFQRHVSINSDLSQALISRSNRPKSRNRVAKNYPKMIDRPLRVSYYHES